MATTTMMVLAGGTLFPEELVDNLPFVPVSFLPADHTWMGRLVGETPVRFYTGRISTDANENLHSQLRTDNVMHPSAQICRSKLKAISLVQYEGKGHTDQSPLVKLIDTLGPKEEQPMTISDLPAVEVEQHPLPLLQGQVLYYLSGWSVYTTLRKNKCETCSEYCLSTTSNAPHEHGYHTVHPVESQAVLTAIKSKGKLVHPSGDVHQLHLRLHHLMKERQEALFSTEKPLDMLMHEMDSTTTWLPPCHKVTRKIIKRLATLKLHMLLRQITSDSKDICQYDSKSALRATLVIFFFFLLT